VASAVLATTLLLSALGCTRNSEPAEADLPNTAARQATLESWRARADAPAVVAGVSDGHGTSWVRASGTAERGGGPAVDAAAPFRIASITKVFVAVVVLQLVEEGRLRLDAPLADFLPGSPYGSVTVRQLMNHTSGIPDYSQVPGLGQQLLAERDRHWSTAEVLALVERSKRPFPPGAGYAYSNTDYVLLGEVIRSVTGRSWAAQVRRRILDPLHLDHTSVAGAEPMPVPVLPGYFDADNDGDQENVETGGPWPALETTEGPAGAIVSTAADLLVFGNALFRGDLLQDSSRTAMEAEGSFHPRNGNYGLGLEILRPDYRTMVWGHGGFVPGFRSVLWYVPSRDVLIVVLTNDSRANPADLAELMMWAFPTRAARS
jgi:D-alanyl-D-alanine carboxypeptidase